MLHGTLVQAVKEVRERAEWTEASTIVIFKEKSIENYIQIHTVIIL